VDRSGNELILEATGTALPNLNKPTSKIPADDRNGRHLTLVKLDETWTLIIDHPDVDRTKTPSRKRQMARESLMFALGASQHLDTHTDFTESPRFGIQRPSRIEVCVISNPRPIGRYDLPLRQA
jgi:hypothetical protein